METYILFYLIICLWTSLPVMYVHRCLSHHQVEFSLPLVYLVKLIEWTKCARYDAMWERMWVGSHIKHHRSSDQPDDPYIPLLRPKFLSKKEVYEITKNHDFEYLKFDKILEKILYGNVVLLTVFVLLWSWQGAILWAVNYIICSKYYFLHNFLGHRVPGYTNGTLPNGCAARNLPFIFKVLYPTEDFHGNHHAWPARANHGIKWWEIDLGFYLIKVLSWVRLIKITDSGRSKPIIEDTTFKIVMVPKITKSTN